MKYLSRKDIEAIAADIVAAYQRLPELSGGTIYRIEPELLCASLLKIKVDYRHLSRDGSILGLTSLSEFGIEIFENDGTQSYYFLDGNTVLVEENLRTDIRKKGRLNFTTMHEAGHQILKRLFPKDYGGQAQSGQACCYRTSLERKRVVTDWEEWQANTLASAILLPEETVNRAMRLFSFHKVKTLNKACTPEIYERFAGMADFLGCSKSALAIRLEHLGLLELEYFYHSESFVS